MSIPILEPTTNTQVERKTSNYQHKNFLSVMKRNSWVPISFDVLDYIDCDKIVSHKAIVTDREFIGYHFPVKECRYYIDQYVVSDDQDTVLEQLDEWFGAGFYEKFVDKDVIVNADNGSLGTRNEIDLKVGLDYVTAKKTLKAEERNNNV